jgi:hypothetical protein
MVFWRVGALALGAFASGCGTAASGVRDDDGGAKNAGGSGLAGTAETTAGAGGSAGATGGGGGATAASSGSSQGGAAAAGAAATSGASGTTASGAGGGSSGSAAQIPRAPGGYIVDGNRVLDADGKPVRLRGMNLPNTIWDPAGGPTTAGDLSLMAAWGANAVRIGLNQGLWLFGEGACSAACYQARVAEIVGWARAAGLDVILDLHFSTAGGAVEPQFMPMPDAESVVFWAQVAARYRDDGRVIFELYNEPHDVEWSVWKLGGDVSAMYDPDTSDADYALTENIQYRATGMQALYSTVRTADAHNLVIAGGLGWAFDLSGIPAFELDGYNIVYATHLYPFSNKLPDSWDHAFGILTETAPVMLTEFGPASTAGDCPDGYLDALFSYANERALSWLGWAWIAGGMPGDGRGGCTTDMFYSEPDPSLPRYALTPFGERIRAELSTAAPPELAGPLPRDY